MVFFLDRFVFSRPREQFTAPRVIAVAALAADLSKENAAANDETASGRGYGALLSVDAHFRTRIGSRFARNMPRADKKTVHARLGSANTFESLRIERSVRDSMGKRQDQTLAALADCEKFCRPAAQPSTSTRG